jgi:hypothetical protein
MAHLSLNSAARGLAKFAQAPKVRAKVLDGVMFIRPTDRKARVNLGKDEQLVDTQNGKIVLEGVDHAEGTYGLRADKYGWFALTPVEKAARNEPSVKISA